MILPAQHIRRMSIVDPCRERTVLNGMTYGIGPAGYDIRIKERIEAKPGGFYLASTIERFDIPDDILGKVHDKSTWARRGIALQNTVMEPGWKGFLTLEITNHSNTEVVIVAGSPIAQIVFEYLAEPTDTPYRGRYQNQESGPQEARLFIKPPAAGFGF